MAATYAIIEGRIQKAIDAINTCENPNRAEIAREFRVPYDRLRSRLRGYQFKTAVRELHNKALKSDQKSALRQYLTTVNQLSLSARLHMMQSTANVLRAQDFARWNSSAVMMNWHIGVRPEAGPKARPELALELYDSAKASFRLRHTFGLICHELCRARLGNAWQTPYSRPIPSSYRELLNN